MRTLELTAHVKAIGRAQGRSATAAAAYRACERIVCEREGQVHDYRRKQGLEASAIVAPDAAPAAFLSRSSLWNGAELRERNGKRGAHAGAFKANATVAREVVFGLPDELSPAGRLALAHTVARHLVAAHGVAVDFSLHAPGKLGDQRNHHCHMLMTTRRVTAAGLGEKAREWDGRQAGSRTVSSFRAILAGMMNEALAAEGHGAAVHVEHRSFKTRGVAKAPTTHQGPGKTNAARRRRQRERQAWERETRQEQAARHGQERRELAARHEANAVARHQDIDGRERRAVEAARSEAAPPAPAPPSPGRLARLFRAVTGQGETSPPPPLPARPQEPRIGELRATFQAERDRVRGDHAGEARSLDERHRDDERQLDRATAVRVERDRLAEVQERRSLAEGHARGLEHEHERQREISGRERSMGPG